MRKSADITKYDPEWQMVRVKVKGSAVPLDVKLKIVASYYDHSSTADAWERVVNWLEGLSMGYRAVKDDGVQMRIAVELSRYNRIRSTIRQQPLDSIQTQAKLAKYPYADRILLWKDLFARNTAWLNKGYMQPEVNAFMDTLYNTFVMERKTVSVNPSKEKLNELRKKSATLKNTHKFFF